jgi:hypothetical protein
MTLSQSGLPLGNVREPCEPGGYGIHHPVVSNTACAETSDVMHRLPPGERPTVNELAITDDRAPLTDEVAPGGWPHVVPVK